MMFCRIVCIEAGSPVFCVAPPRKVFIYCDVCGLYFLFFLFCKVYISKNWQLKHGLYQYEPPPHLNLELSLFVVAPNSEMLFHNQNTWCFLLLGKTPDQWLSTCGPQTPGWAMMSSQEVRKGLKKCYVNLCYVLVVHGHSPWPQTVFQGACGKENFKNHCSW